MSVRTQTIATCVAQRSWARSVQSHRRTRSAETGRMTYQVTHECIVITTGILAPEDAFKGRPVIKTKRRRVQETLNPD